MKTSSNSKNSVASEGKFVVACERHYWITSTTPVTASLPFKLDFEELCVLVAVVKYYNKESKTKGTRKGDRSHAAVEHIASMLLELTEGGWNLSPEIIYYFVENYQGKTQHGKIYPTAYNTKTGLVNFARRFRTRRRFCKVVSAMLGTYGKIKKNHWNGEVPDWVRF